MLPSSLRPKVRPFLFQPVSGCCVRLCRPIAPLLAFRACGGACRKREQEKERKVGQQRVARLERRPLAAAGTESPVYWLPALFAGPHCPRLSLVQAGRKSGRERESERRGKEAKESRIIVAVAWLQAGFLFLFFDTRPWALITQQTRGTI